MQQFIINLKSISFFWFSMSFSIVMMKLWSVYDSAKNYKNKRNVLEKIFWKTIIVIFPSIYFGIRSETVGADTLNNVASYLHSGQEYSLVDVTQFRYIYDLLRFFIYQITRGNVVLYFVIIAFLTLYIFISGLMKWDEIDYAFSLYVYYMLFSFQLMNQARQMLAVSVIFYSLFYLEKKQLKKYILISLVASMIHNSALISLFFFILKNRRIYERRIYLNLYLFLIVFIPYLYPSLISLLSYLVSNDYKKYFINLLDLNVGKGLFLTLAQLFAPYMILGKYNKRSEYKSLFIIALLAIPIRLLGYKSYYLIRLQYYVLIGTVVYYSNILLKVSSEKRMFLKYLLIIFYFLFFLLYYVYLNDSYILPYKTWTGA